MLINKEFCIDDYEEFSKLVKNWCFNLEPYRNRKIVVDVEKSRKLYAIICACLQMNITFILVDSGLPLERKMQIIDESKANAIIDNTYSVRFLCGGEMTKNDIAYMIFTSGTTGKPKGIQITYDNLKRFVVSVSEKIDFKSKTLISFTSISFDIFILESVVALYNHMKIVILEDEYRRNPKKIIEKIEKNNVDFIQCTPSSMKMLVNYNASFLGKIKTILLGGEPLEYDLLHKIKDNFHGNLYNMYGPSETTVWVTYKKIDSEITIGKPFESETEIYIVDKAHNILTPGETGEIAITGKLVGAGYYNNDTLTSSKFGVLNGKACFYSGDYGKYDIRGDLIIYGRMDNQIKINGHRIETGEIKGEVLQIRGIDEAEVYYDKNRKQLVVFYIGNKLDTQYLKSILRRRLPNYMIPNSFINIPEFCFNNNGKLDLNQTSVKYTDICVGVDMESYIIALINIINSLGLVQIDYAKEEDLLSDHGIDSITMISILVELGSKNMLDLDVCMDSINKIKTFRDLRILIDEGTL